MPNYFANSDFGTSASDLGKTNCSSFVFEIITL
jgi:hypothetical protein